jgi:hypothetical protein
LSKLWREFDLVTRQAATPTVAHGACTDAQQGAADNAGTSYDPSAAAAAAAAAALASAAASAQGGDAQGNAWGAAGEQAASATDASTNDQASIARGVCGKLESRALGYVMAVYCLSHAANQPRSNWRCSGSLQARVEAQVVGQSR